MILLRLIINIFWPNTQQANILEATDYSWHFNEIYHLMTVATIGDGIEHTSLPTNYSRAVTFVPCYIMHGTLPSPPSFRNCSLQSDFGE